MGRCSESFRHGPKTDGRFGTEHPMPGDCSVQVLLARCRLLQHLWPSSGAAAHGDKALAASSCSSAGADQRCAVQRQSCVSPSPVTYCARACAWGAIKLATISGLAGLQPAAMWVGAALRPSNKLSACAEYRSRVSPILAGPLKLSTPRPLHPAPHVWGARLVWGTVQDGTRDNGAPAPYCRHRASRALLTTGVGRVATCTDCHEDKPECARGWPGHVLRPSGVTAGLRYDDKLGSPVGALLRHRLAVYPCYGVQCHMRDG